MQPTDGFDEAWYLEKYGDVRDAVSTGVFSSGHQHFVEFGYDEGRSARLITTGAFFSIFEPLVSDDPLEQTKSAWSVSAEEQARAVGWYWMAHPLVRRRTNEMASGDPDCDGYELLAKLLRARQGRPNTSKPIAGVRVRCIGARFS